MAIKMDDELRPGPDPHDGTYRLQAELDLSLSDVALMKVAEIEGIDPLDMDPVYDGRNFDLLNLWGKTCGDDGAIIEGSITVTIGDYDVTVDSDGIMTICPMD